jgi:hypothetical protein
LALAEPVILEDLHLAVIHKADIFHIIIKVMQHRAPVAQVVISTDIEAQTAVRQL